MTTTTDIEYDIKELEAALFYIETIKPSFILSSDTVNDIINNPSFDKNIRIILINEFKQSIFCPICKIPGSPSISFSYDYDGFLCRVCYDVHYADIKSVYKITSEFVNAMPVGFIIKNGTLVKTNSTTKTDLYRYFFIVKNREESFNQVLQKYNLVNNNDNDIVKNIDNLLESLWHKLANSIY